MISVVLSLITYTNHEVTKQCLQSLEKLSLGNNKLIVLVINNNLHESFDYKWKGKGTFEIVQNPDNVGFAGGHNVSFRYALKENADYIVVLNNDTTVDPLFLKQLLAAAETKPDGGLFGPKIYFAKGHEFHKERYKAAEKGNVIWYAGGKIDWHNLILSHRGVDEVDTGQYDELSETEFVSGCCMLIRTQALRRVGLFDERYFLYLEDSDLNMRMKRAGFSLYYVPSARIWHVNAGSTGGSGSSLQDYFISRNRLLFGDLYAPLRTRMALFRESLKLLTNGREWQRKGVMDYYKRRFGKGSYRV